MSLEFIDWGLIDYKMALDQQLSLVEEVAQSKRADTLIFCAHPPIVTLGRGTQSEDVFAWQGPTVEISRGGRATYHGPSQQVVYPIINLNHPRGQRKEREIAGYLRTLEDSIVNVLRSYNIDAVGKSLRKKDPSSQAQEETGVWVGDKKIASLGIGVRKWITFHGAAINIDYDPAAFTGLKPCGFQSSTMISLEQLLNQKIDRKTFNHKLKEELLAHL